MRKSILEFSVIFLAGCSSMQKAVGLLQDPSSRIITEQTPKLYAQATLDLENQKFEQSENEYSNFLTEQPTTAYTQIAQFNLGRALMGQKKFAAAIDHLRALAIDTSGNAPSLQAQAFYQLSFCYEAQGDKINALASLLDSYHRQKYFAREVATAEIPARIAGAYASLGNFDEAKIYYAQAESGVQQLKREVRSGEVPNWLPRTLFYMGEVSLRKISFEDIASVLRPLSKAQFYLLESAELGSSSWSEQSSRELIETYENTLAVIAKPPVLKDSDQLTAQRHAQEKQWQLVQEFDQVLEEMNSYEIPNHEKLSMPARNVFTKVKKIRVKLAAILSQPKVGQEITPDAQERKNKIRGKVDQPNSELEQKYFTDKVKKSSPPLIPKVESHKQAVPPVTSPQTSPTQDPNL
jgi:tetratricopeptide (TPR) repeat protein